MLRNTFAVAALALALVVAKPSLATVVYENTTIDTLTTLVYSANGASHVGDTVSLDGFDRRLTSASVQFFNLGVDAGTFSAILTFWNVGAPVGTQIGAPFLVSGIAIDALDIRTVTFSGLDLIVPDALVFTVEVASATAGLDLGLNLFEPPTIGTSDGDSLIIGTTSASVTSFSVGIMPSGQGNLFLRLEATSVPEPSTIAMLLVAALLLAGATRQRPRAPALRGA